MPAFPLKWLINPITPEAFSEKYWEAPAARNQEKR